MSDIAQAAPPPMGQSSLPSLRSMGPDLVIDATLRAVAYQDRRGEGLSRNIATTCALD